ncbi:hypothetical protein JAAARDRAFT_79621 [Jaapia argillacea MUCL 33604]|uniref:F-box domain-containing protein n=1 Tax=Jaapia argillacea MUCL 33604 TaxID=933084 RepID=A0A067PZ08_9AGAM|nr:hypothetical protein JAAARDRAFT_79621 [Jaapia argillacea MUCL 33604]
MAENDFGGSNPVLKSMHALQISVVQQKPHQPAVCRLPPELIRDILQLALPLDCDLDEGVNHRTEEIPLSAVLSHKRQLVLVCKSWTPVGTELLYEHVPIWRRAQLSSLLRTLQMNAGLGGLVKTLALYLFIPARQPFVGDLSTLVAYCSRIRRVILCPSWDPESVCASVLVSPLSSVIHFDTLTHLEVNNVLASVTVHQVLNSCLGIQSLKLALPVVPPLAICLPQLETLHLTSMSPKAVGLRNLVTWSIPRLRALTLANYEQVALDPFLAAHGTYLKFLHFQLPASSDLRLDDDTLSTSCPQLEHLVMPCSGFWPTQHPTLKWLDLWEPWEPTFCRRAEETLKILQAECLPALRQVRFLDTSLSHVRDLPRILPPGLVTNDGIGKCDLVGLTVVQTKSCLMRNVPGQRYEFEVDSDTDSRYEGSSPPDETDFYDLFDPDDDLETPPSPDSCHSSGSSYLWEGEAVDWAEAVDEIDRAN